MKFNTLNLGEKWFYCTDLAQLLLFIAVFSSKGVTHPVILHILSHTVTQGRGKLFSEMLWSFLINRILVQR